jgi:hypothetical protein|tara:strand:- start:1035 stop:1484 length:450 start_codon:yes stop_codon:yes gene_type:complete
MGIGAKIITEMTEELATFLSNFANKSSASVMTPSESYGVLKDLPYTQMRSDPSTRGAEVVVPNKLDPRTFSSIQSQTKDLQELQLDSGGYPYQENRSPEMIRESISSMQNWIDSKKDLPAFSDVIYPMAQKIEADKDLLRSRSKPRIVD